MIFQEMARLGRPPKALLVLTADEREVLERYVRRGWVNRNLAFRARIVLGCVTSSGTEVARSLRTTNQTVCKWRNRFAARRLDGLLDEPRPGAERTVTDDQVEAIVVKTMESTPKGRTHWSTRLMAKNVGLSHSTIGRIWRTFGLKPHATKDFRLSDDPLLVKKVRDIVGLYMPPVSGKLSPRILKDEATRGAKSREANDEVYRCIQGRDGSTAGVATREVGARVSGGDRRFKVST